MPEKAEKNRNSIYYKDLALARLFFGRAFAWAKRLIMTQLPPMGKIAGQNDPFKGIDRH